MEKTFEIQYLERENGAKSSIGRVFRQVAKKLDRKQFKIEFIEMPFGVNFSGIFKNLKFFRPTPADIYHITGDIHYLALILPAEKTILTIHDLVILRLRKGIRRYILKKLFFDLPVKKVKFITTVSAKIKAEIIAATDCPPEKIKVIENPLQEIFAYAPTKKFNHAQPRLLQIGTAPNKNLANTIAAVAGLNCHLKIIGKIDADLQKQLADSKIQYENVWDLDEPAIKNEYFNADIILFCSTYEGFGLPIIEGQAMRKPIITSNLSPLREVAGKGGAALVDPSKPQEIRRAVERIIKDKIYRENLISAGLQNIERFKSENIARQYQEYYLNILQSKV